MDLTTDVALGTHRGEAAGTVSRRPLPTGIGLRAPHYQELLAHRPAIGLLEVHAENYFVDGGARIDWLTRLGECYPLSLHGVGLSLGSVDPIDPSHLALLNRAVERFQPLLVSEHLSWCSVDGIFANDLLPLPYTEEALQHVSQRIEYVQDYLGRQILIENVSSYVEFQCSEMSEPEFLAGVAARSGCGILLDLNNVYVSAVNHGFDPGEYLRAVPTAGIQEVHLAGHTRVERAGRDYLVDTHNTQVCEPVWALYGDILQRCGNVPTVIEWDADIPPLALLLAEADKANRLAVQLR